jgi:hypothetical protein
MVALIEVNAGFTHILILQPLSPQRRIARAVNINRNQQSSLI